MSLNIDITIEMDREQVEAEVERAVVQAVGETLEFARRQLHSQIPAQRVKTRRYLKADHEGLKGAVGVRFPAGSRFPKRGTQTEEILQRAWAFTKPLTRDYLGEAIETLIEDL